MANPNDLEAPLKPLISILLAVYNPNMEWLQKQLYSIEQQDYPNLELHVIDDCTEEISFEKIKACIEETVARIPHSIERNSVNLGSNRTFEKLVGKAGGEYIAFCDQDDIWMEDKLTCLMRYMSDEKVQIACSDVIVIDEKGEKRADSLTDVRKRHKFYSGEGLFRKILFRNFVIGSTSLMRTSFVRAALPFPENMVHDHWLALIASIQGDIALSDRPLVFYRIHDTNQTNIMAKIVTKQDYIDQSILLYYNRLKEIQGRIPKSDIFTQAQVWARARKMYAEGERGVVRDIWKYRNFNRPTALFELIMVRMPDKIFTLAVKVIKNRL